MAKTSGSLDTCVVLRLLTQDIPEQTVAAEKIIAGASGQLAISDLALNECIFGLERYYTYTREQIAAALEAVMRVPAINCNRVLLSKALSYYVANQNLSFEDCALVSYAELNDAKPLFTFDKQLAKKLPAAQLIV